VTDRPRPRSPLVSVGLFVVLFAIGVAAMAAGVPVTPVVLVLSGVGAALLIDAQSGRRFDRVATLEPGALDPYPLQFAVERWKFGPTWQFRILPWTRRHWAPGVLGVGYGEVRFVPAKATKAAFAWTSRPTSVEIEKVLQACVVRFHDAGGPAAQFTFQQPADVVREHLAPMLPVAAGSGERRR
jgi:hypothetical protein